MEHRSQEVHNRALKINLDAARYGTFAEIGAGQEVARWFFHVGGAAGTVAKTMSAYDMAVSDAIYGPCARYVSRQRLAAMLDREWDLLLERLDHERGAGTAFFVFADTVAAKSYGRQEEGHGWLGIRFQTEPRSTPSEIIIHARMWDADNADQQEALGMLGVNLIHGAFYLAARPEELIGSLMGDLTRDRMEVDMIKFSGPAFAGWDNRLMSLQLVQQRLTNAAIFTADGEVMEPAELLHQQPILCERGSFRPMTRINLDMCRRALAQMRSSGRMEGAEPVVLLEMTLRNLLAARRSVEHADFLARVDTLGALDQTVMISNYSRFHNVAAYFRRYTRKPVVMVMGVPTLAQVFREKYYNDIEGGVLEALGRLFKGAVQLYIYPWRNPGTGELVTAENFQVAPHLRHLYAHLLDNRFLVPIREFAGEDLSVLPSDVLARLQGGDPSWEDLVPPEVAHMIKKRKFFGLS
jgi:hypothetical protein